MEQLESSGLLKEEGGGRGVQAETAGTGSLRSGGGFSTGGERDSSGQGMQGSGDRVGSAGAAVGGSGEASGGEGPAEQAEQKVLGYLAHEPSWSKVLDTGSGSIYYWNLLTNEVVWEVPKGMDADNLIPPEGEGNGVAGESDAGGGTQPQLSVAELVPASALPAAVDPASASAARREREVSVRRSAFNAAPEVMTDVQAEIAGGPLLCPLPHRKGGTHAMKAEDEVDDTLEEGQLPPGIDEDYGDSIGKASNAGTAAVMQGGSDPHSSATTAVIATPQAHVTAVLESLEADAREAAGGFLRSLPAIARLAVEAAVRLADWRELGEAQHQAAAAAVAMARGRAGDERNAATSLATGTAGTEEPHRPLCWETYESHVTSKVWLPSMSLYFCCMFNPPLTQT